MIELPSRLFRDRRLARLTPCWAAMALRVSPARTVYPSVAAAVPAPDADPEMARTWPGWMMVVAERLFFVNTDSVETPYWAAMAETVSPATTVWDAAVLMALTARGTELAMTDAGMLFEAVRA
jgi:hypothetical protein